MRTQIIPTAGQRIACVRMKDEYSPVPPGTQGTVLSVVDFMGEKHIHMKWDNGRTLSLISSVDAWRKV